MNIKMKKYRKNLLLIGISIVFILTFTFLFFNSYFKAEDDSLNVNEINFNEVQNINFKKTGKSVEFKKEWDKGYFNNKKRWAAYYGGIKAVFSYNSEENTISADLKIKINVGGVHGWDEIGLRVRKNGKKISQIVGANKIREEKKDKEYVNLVFLGGNNKTFSLENLQKEETMILDIILFEELDGGKIDKTSDKTKYIHKYIYRFNIQVKRDNDFILEKMETNTKEENKLENFISLDSYGILKIDSTYSNTFKNKVAYTISNSAITEENNKKTFVGQDKFNDFLKKNCDSLIGEMIITSSYKNVKLSEKKFFILDEDLILSIITENGYVGKKIKINISYKNEKSYEALKTYVKNNNIKDTNEIYKIKCKLKENTISSDGEKDEDLYLDLYSVTLKNIIEKTQIIVEFSTITKKIKEIEKLKIVDDFIWDKEVIIDLFSNNKNYKVVSRKIYIDTKPPILEENENSKILNNNNIYSNNLGSIRIKDNTLIKKITFIFDEKEEIRNVNKSRLTLEDFKELINNRNNFKMKLEDKFNNFSTFEVRINNEIVEKIKFNNNIHKGNTFSELNDIEIDLGLNNIIKSINIKHKLILDNDDNQIKYKSNYIFLSLNFEKKEIKENGETKEEIGYKIETNFINIENKNKYFENYNFNKIKLKNLKFLPYGVYELEIYDLSNNKKIINIIKYNNKIKNDNEDIIKEKFKIRIYHKVVLPNEFSTLNNKNEYIFKTKSDALEYAKFREKELYLLKIKDNTYRYKSFYSENIFEEYDSLELLDLSIDKWSKKYYVGEFLREDDELDNSNIMEKRDNKFFLNRFLLSDHNIKIKIKDDISIYRTEVDYEFKDSYIKYNHDQEYILDTDYILVKVTFSNSTFFLTSQAFKINKKLNKNQLTSGYYAVIISDRDKIEKKEYKKEDVRFIILYINKKVETLARVKRINNESLINEDIIINEKFIKDNTFPNQGLSLNFSEFNIIDLKDYEEDNYYTIIEVYIENKKYKYLYSDIKKIGKFHFDEEQQKNKSGNIKIKIIKRDKNIIEYSFFIPTSPPKIKIFGDSEFSDNLQIRVYIREEKNPVKKIEISKYFLDYNTLLEDSSIITVDDENNKIGIENPKNGVFIFNFKNGGKYKVKVVDAFNKVYILDNISFGTKIPKYNLNGVKNNSITNKTVYLNFKNDIIYKAFLFVDDYKREINFENSDKFKKIEKGENTTLIFTPNKEDISKIEIYLINTLNKSEYILISFTFNTKGETVQIRSLDNLVEYKNNEKTKDSIRISEISPSSYLSIRREPKQFILLNEDRIISQDGVYTIEVTDFIGNKTEKTITIDKKVDYKLNGKFYNDEINNIKYTQKNFDIVFLEDIKILKVNGEYKNTLTHIKLEEDKSYEIYIEDMLGNNVNLRIVKNSNNVKYKIINVNKDNVSNKIVKLEIFEDVKNIEIEYFSYSKNENKKINYTKGLEFKEEGNYNVKILGKNNMLTAFNFKIDKKANFSTSLRSSYSQEEVYYKILEDLEVIVYKDGKKIEHYKQEKNMIINKLNKEDEFNYVPKNGFSESGNYKIIFIEELDKNMLNKSEVIFNIVPKISREYKITLEKDEKIIKLIKDNKDKKLDKNKNLTISETGKYSVFIENKDKKLYKLDLLIDRKEPEIKIERVDNILKLHSPNKNNLKMRLFKNNKEVENFNKTTIKEYGSYKLLLEDDIGNKNEYNFNFKRKLSKFEFFLIIFFIIANFVIVFIILKYRYRKTK